MLIDYSDQDLIPSSFVKNTPGQTRVISGFKKSIQNRVKNI